MINNTASSNPNCCWFILGPTGIGKTFISLEIGHHFNNQIINTDAFSLYKEASIMTAKATKKEQAQVKHRMIDILDLFNVNYHQKLFKKDALNEINSVHQNSQIPLVVGGTNYFVESLLFNYESKTEEEKEEKNESDPIEFLEKEDFIKNMKINDSLLLDEIKKIKKESKTEDECYTKIKEYLDDNLNEKNNNKKNLIKILSVIDKKSSNFYNDNDIRRISKSISFFISYNKKKSEILNNQIVKLNFEKNKIIILFPKEIDPLLKRITSRIDQMIEEGLSEIIYIFNTFIMNKKDINFEVGVLQSIGYKEFYDLYQALNKDIINEAYNYHLKEKDDEDKLKIYNKNILENIIYKDEKLKNIFENCRQKLINNTLNYAKYQIKFIKKRILPYISGYKIFEINDYSKETYLKEYIPQIIDYLNNNEYINIIDENKNKNKLEDWKRYYCDVCKCEMNGENDYNSHMKSNKHKKQKDKLRKKQKQKQISENFKNVEGGNEINNK